MTKNNHIYFILQFDPLKHSNHNSSCNLTYTPIIAAIRKEKSKAYITKRWHVLAVIIKSLPFMFYKRM